MSLGSEYDDAVIRLLALQAQTVTRLARQLKVDDGALMSELWRLDKAGLIEVVDVAGNTPVWALSEHGRAKAEQLRSRRDAAE